MGTRWNRLNGSSSEHTVIQTNLMEIGSMVQENNVLNGVYQWAWWPFLFVTSIMLMTVYFLAYKIKLKITQLFRLIFANK